MQTKLFISSLLLLLFFTGCLNDKGILPSHFFEQTPCADNDTVGVWQYVGLDGEDVRSIAIHPHKPHIIYVGSSKNFSAGTTGKLYLSSDCGNSWRVILEGDFFKRTLFDPLNPNIIYTTPHELIKSTDGGKSWINISDEINLDWETSVGSILIDPINNNIIYAGTGGFFGGQLYKSTDAGENWVILSKKDTLSESIISLGINAQDNKVLYAGTDWSGRVYKTVNGGKNWTITGLGETNNLIHDIFVHPQNPNNVIVGWIGFSQSLDSGNSWSTFSEGLPESAYGNKICMDPISLDYYCVISAKDSAGVYKRAPNTSYWYKIGIEGIDSFSKADMIISPDNKYLYCGTKYNGLFKIKLR